MLYKITIFAPLLGFLIAGLGGRRMGDKMAQLITSSLMGVSFLSALIIFKTIAMEGNAVTVPLLEWIHIGTFVADWGLKVDSLSSVMLVVVCSVSFLVHIYSIGYMHGDKSVPRFMSYLSLFTFAMLMLVTAPNFIQLFFGWEGVGLASYLLIGFWYEKDSANAASMKAFLVNRVGDVGLALGIAAIYYLFQSVEFAPVFASLGKFAASQAGNAEIISRPFIRFFGWQVDGFELAAILLFIGAMGKSAQLGLHTWLPDAMEGPTPVSALIHAATMVTAGVFMVARLSPLYELTPFAKEVIVFVGAATAFFAATVAMTQNDIKRVIAYSTCSQLGYMFFAAGCGAYAAAIFHLFTHAFFKALLFLSAGSVIHAMSGEQDMHKMGGIAKHIPITHAMVWIGSLALAGIPIFAGYYSKDLIIETAFASQMTMANFAFVSGLIVALLTSFYSWRVIMLTFYGKPRANESVMAHIHESGIPMLIPLFALAVGAIFSGWYGYKLFFADDGAFWGKSIFMLNAKFYDAVHAVPMIVKVVPVALAAGGIAAAYAVYSSKNDISGKITARLSSLHKFLLNKWYFDELYEKLFVRSSFLFGRFFWKFGDGKIIDGLGPDGFASMTLKTAQGTSQVQTGFVYHYAFAVLLGLIAIMSWYLFSEFGWPL